MNAPLHWLSHQVAPTLKLALRLDKMNHTQIVHDIITHAKLTEKHEKSTKRQSRRCKGGGALTAAILEPKNSYRKERSFCEFRTESLQLVLSNAQSLVLLAIVVIGLYLGFKREFSKLIGFLVVSLVAVGLVFNADGVKDIFTGTVQ